VEDESELADFMMLAVSLPAFWGEKYRYEQFPEKQPLKVIEGALPEKQKRPSNYRSALQRRRDPTKRRPFR